MTFPRATILAVALAVVTQPAQAATRAELEAQVAAHAAANGVPVELVHRVIIRESRYNPGLIGKGGAMGLMQIKAATARGVGYRGLPAGLLNAETNLTYAVRYLAGAYRLAGGDHNRAVSYYARGYYYAAKGRGKTVEALARPGAQSFALIPILAITPAGRTETTGAATTSALEAKRDREP